MPFPYLKQLAAGLTAVGIFALVGCESNQATGEETSSATPVASTPASAAIVAQINAEQTLAENSTATFMADDQWDESGATTITLNGTTATSDSDSVVIEEGSVTITESGVYRLTGTFQGTVWVDSDSDDSVILILDSVTITSPTNSAIRFENAGQAVVSLAEGTTNTLTDASTYDDADPKAALFAKAPLTITGEGTLIANGQANDAIASSKDLTILSGTIVVTSVDDGIRGKDSLTIEGGSIDVTSTGDALKSSNDTDTDQGWVHITDATITLDAQGDGIDAASDVVIQGGELTITTTATASTTDADAPSTKGIKSATLTVIEGGSLTIDSADDAIHSNGTIALNAGTATLTSGDDAVHADGNLIVTDGTWTATQSVEGLEAAQVIINGGTIDITASDDGLNAATDTQTNPMEFDTNAYIQITGGEVTIDAEGDGIDSNGDLDIDGGTIYVYGPTVTGNSALDTGGTISISGGTLIATGTAGMMETPSTQSAQSWVAAVISGSAGDTVTLSDASGEILAFQAAKNYQSVIISTPEMSDGSYTVSTSQGTSVEATANESSGMGAMGMGGMGGRGGMGGEPGGRQEGGDFQGVPEEGEPPTDLEGAPMAPGFR